jgi:holin-like protein
LVLVGFQWLGDQSAAVLDINLPGPLLGMLWLLVVLTVVPLDFLDKTSNLLIQNLSLMFVPPSVGAFFLTSQIYQQFPELLAIIIMSTVFAIGFMAALIRLLRLSGDKK